MRKFTHIVTIVLLASVFVSSIRSTVAQQSANQQAVGGVEPTGTVSGRQTERRGTILTFQSSNTPVARYENFRFNSSDCYVRYQSGQYSPVPFGYCEH